MATVADAVTRAQWRHICRILDESQDRTVGTIVLVSDRGGSFGYGLTCWHNFDMQHRLKLAEKNTKIRGAWLIPNWAKITDISIRRPVVVAGELSNRDRDFAVLKIPREVIDHFGLRPISINFDPPADARLTVIGFQRPAELVDPDAVRVRVVAVNKEIWQDDWKVYLQVFEVLSDEGRVIPWDSGMSGAAMFACPDGPLVGLATLVAPNETGSEEWRGYGISMRTIARTWTMIAEHCHVEPWGHSQPNASPDNLEDAIQALRRRLLDAHDSIEELESILVELNSLKGASGRLPPSGIALKNAVRQAISQKKVDELRRRMLMAETDRQLKAIHDELNAIEPLPPQGVALKRTVEEALERRQAFLMIDSLRQRHYRGVKGRGEETGGVWRHRWWWLGTSAAVILIAAGVWLVDHLPLRNAGKRVPAAIGVFPVQSHYSPSGVMGDVGDLTIGSGEDGAHRFTYTAAGNGPHEWEYKYVNDELNPRAAGFVGVRYLSPAGCWGTSPDCGFDLSARWRWRPLGWAPPFRHLEWTARCVGCEAKVDFLVGGISWIWARSGQRWERVAPPYADTMHGVRFGITTLTNDWQSFEQFFAEVPEHEFRRVVGGFGWVMDWASNSVEPNDDGTAAKKAKRFVIEIKDIQYRRWQP